MQKFITRTVNYTKISGVVMQVGGDNERIEVDPILEFGILDNEKATKVLRKKYGYNAVVTDCEYLSELRKMTMEKFMEASEKVETGEEN